MRKGFSNIILIILVVIIAGILGYLTFSQLGLGSLPNSSTKAIPTYTPTISPIPSSTPISDSNSNTISVLLGQQFTLKQGQVAKISSTGMEVEIKEFVNSPCPKNAACIWSGLGVNIEFRYSGKVQKGVVVESKTQSFGYQTTIIKTDYATYAILVVEKIK